MKIIPNLNAIINKEIQYIKNNNYLSNEYNWTYILWHNLFDTLQKEVGKLHKKNTDLTVKSVFKRISPMPIYSSRLNPLEFNLMCCRKKYYNPNTCIHISEINCKHAEEVYCIRLEDLSVSKHEIGECPFTEYSDKPFAD